MSVLMADHLPPVPGWPDRSTAITRVGFRGSLAVEISMDLLSELRRHLRNGRELGDRGLADAPGRAERLEKARPDRRPDPRNPVEHGLQGPPRPQLLMIGDREAVRLVADLLEGVECGRRGVEDERVEALTDVDFLLLLGQRDHREVVEAEVLEYLEPDIELAATPIDQNQVRQRRPLLQRLREPPRQDLAQRGEVVGARDGPDAEALVVVLLETAVLPDDHRADLLGPLDVGDVIALDAVRETGEAERALKLLEHELLTIVTGEEAVLKRDHGVRLGHRDELPLGSSLGRVQLHAPARERGEP